MPSRTPRHLRVPVGLILRISLALVTSVLNFVVEGALQVLPWAVLLILVDVVSSYLLDGPVPILRSRLVAEWAAVAMAGLAAAGAVSAGPAGVLLLLVPAAMAGQRLRPLGASLLTALQLIVALAVASRSEFVESAGAVAFQQRLALACIAAFLITGAVAYRTARTDETQVRAAHAAEMLEQLTALSRGFNRGFDGPAHAEDAVAELLRVVSAERGLALIADLERRPQTWATAGVWRHSWPDVESPESPWSRAWRGEPIAIPRWRDGQGRQRAILAVPLSARDGSPIGMLVADRSADFPFTQAELTAGLDAAARHETFIELASLFAWLRDESLYEERDRLSRQMHDGIGQEIAALGYQIDAVRMLVRQRNPELEPLLADVRTNLTEVASDVRLHISDLRRRSPSIPRAHVAIETRLAAFRTATGITTTSDLEPLPEYADTGADLALYRVVVALLRDAAESNPTRVSVHLETHLNTVTMVACHNGPTRLTLESLEPHTGMSPRASVTLPERSDEGVVVRVVILLPEKSTTHPRRSPTSGRSRFGRDQKVSDLSHTHREG